MTPNRSLPVSAADSTGATGAEAPATLAPASVGEVHRADAWWVPFRTGRGGLLLIGAWRLTIVRREDDSCYATWGAPGGGLIRLSVGDA